VHIIVGQAGRIGRVAAEHAVAVAVEARQPGLGAEPHEAGMVLHDGQHRFLRQALFQADVLEVEAARGAGPGQRSQVEGEHGGQQAQDDTGIRAEHK
jgi:hypothetical protein